MKPCVIFNPAARGEKAKQFLQFLNSISQECSLLPTTAPGHAIDLVVEAIENGYTTFVAAGGDGTVNEVINGIGKTKGGFANCRLGILPFGTVNVFAKELQISEDLEMAWAHIQAGKTRRIDVARAEMSDDGTNVVRYFVQLAGAGLDANAIERVDLNLKKRFGPLAYVWAGLQVLNRPLPDVRVTANGIETTGKLVLLGNGRYYGGRFEVFPQASLNDGMIDVCVFPKTSLKTVFGLGLGQMYQDLPEFMGVKYFQTRKLELTCETPAPFEVEGDVVGKLPAKISVVPDTLSVIV